MTDPINLSTFPDSKFTALTMLYLQNQDCSKLSPSDLLEKYYEVYEELKTKDAELRGYTKQSVQY